MGESAIASMINLSGLSLSVFLFHNFCSNVYKRVRDMDVPKRLDISPSGFRSRSSGKCGDDSPLLIYRRGDREGGLTTHPKPLAIKCFICEEDFSEDKYPVQSESCGDSICIHCFNIFAHDILEDPYYNCPLCGSHNAFNMTDPHTNEIACALLVRPGVKNLPSSQKANPRRKSNNVENLFPNAVYFGCDSCEQVRQLSDDELIDQLKLDEPDDYGRQMVTLDQFVEIPCMSKNGAFSFMRGHCLRCGVEEVNDAKNPVGDRRLGAKGKSTAAKGKSAQPRREEKDLPKVYQLLSLRNPKHFRSGMKMKKQGVRFIKRRPKNEIKRSPSREKFMENLRNIAYGKVQPPQRPREKRMVPRVIHEVRREGAKKSTSLEGVAAKKANENMELVIPNENAVSTIQAELQSLQNDLPGLISPRKLFSKNSVPPPFDSSKFTASVEPNRPFPNLWNEMKQHSWNRVLGGSGEIIYIKPGCSVVHGMENKDYFIGNLAILNYISSLIPQWKPFIPSDQCGR